MAFSGELLSKRIKSSYKNYFFSVRRGKRGHYLILAESVPQGGGKFKRNSILVGEDDLSLIRDTLDEIIQELRRKAA